MSDLWKEFTNCLLGACLLSSPPRDDVNLQPRSYYMIYNVKAPDWLPYSTALGSIPVYLPANGAPTSEPLGRADVLHLPVVAIVGMAMLYRLGGPGLKSAVMNCCPIIKSPA